MNSPSSRLPILTCCFLLPAGFTACIFAAAPQPPAKIGWGAAGMDSSIEKRIDRLVARGIEHGDMSGCVVLIGRKAGIVFEHAYGNRQVEPSVEPMTIDTLFDMASLTKPLATATSAMILIQRGQLRLSDKVSKYFPDFAANGKADVTVENLLTHSSGLLPDDPLSDYDDGWKSAENKICELTLLTPPGSDVQILGREFHPARQDCRESRGQTGKRICQSRDLRPARHARYGL